jgi:hypothetical protein
MRFELGFEVARSNRKGAPKLLYSSIQMTAMINSARCLYCGDDRGDDTLILALKKGTGRMDGGWMIG